MSRSLGNRWCKQWLDHLHIAENNSFFSSEQSFQVGKTGMREILLPFTFHRSLRALQSCFFSFVAYFPRTFQRLGQQKLRSTHLTDGIWWVRPYLYAATIDVVGLMKLQIKNNRLKKHTKLSTRRSEWPIFHLSPTLYGIIENKRYSELFRWL